MTLTYKTDDSFFTLVLPPFTYYGFVVKKWFMQTNNSRFRYIRDIELEREFCNLEMIDMTYPGIKTIGIIFNPWARMLHGYNTLCAMKKNKDTSYIDLSILELGSFNKFIHSLPNMKSVEPYKFTLATPMSRWYSYQNNSEVRTVDYLLKAEALVEEFKILQEYFCCSEPLAIIDPLLEYKKSYNKKTQAIVAEVFKEDIEQFGYKF
jgi:hypothetical protein